LAGKLEGKIESDEFLRENEMDRPNLRKKAILRNLEIQTFEQQ